jgi:signal peptidase I
MEPTTPLQDQLANISPVIIVLIVMVLTLVRVALAKAKSAGARSITELCDTINFVLILAFLLIRPFVAQAFYIPSESMQNTLQIGDRLIVNKFGYRLTEPQRGDVVVFEAPPQATGGRAGVDFIKRLVGKSGDTVQVKGAKMAIDGVEIDPRTDAPSLHDYLRNHLGLREADSVRIQIDGVLVNGTEKISKERIAEMLGQPGAKLTLTPGQTLLNGKPLDDKYTREDPSYNFPEQGGNVQGEANGTYKIPEGHVFVMGDNRNRSEDSHRWGPLKRENLIGRAFVVFWPPARAGAIR